MEPKWGQDVAKRGQDGAKRGQEGPRWGQDGAKMEPKLSKNVVSENLEKRVPGMPLFWTPKWVPKRVQELLKIGSNFGPFFGPILGSLLEQFWDPSGPQDRPGRRLEEPKRAK